mgnify:CR=1 FL=1
MEDFNVEPPHQFDSPLFDSARAALSADFSAVASPQFPADVPATHPASSEQARNPVSPAVAADYENLAGLYHVPEAYRLVQRELSGP